MAEKLEFYFSHSFEGTIWNMVLVPDRSVLVMEVRNDERRQVSFSAFEFLEGRFLWKDIKVAESWWVNLTSANEKAVLLTKFENTNNPDSVSNIVLDLESGATLNDYPKLETRMPQAQAEIPIQYVQESNHFETIRNFLGRAVKKEPLQFVEYLENSGLIFMSVYFNNMASEFENYLFVFDADGKMLMQDKIGNSLKGLGLETFFLSSGLLFYVKNKVELVTYRIV